MSGLAVRTRKLQQRFGDVRVLRGLDLDVKGPGVHGFLGVNGAGKTTTLRILLGFLRPTSGSVEVLGEQPGPDRNQARRQIGYLPQHPAFHPWMTAAEALELAARLHGLERARRRARVDALLERLSLASAAKRRIGGFSGGMRQRLGLAQALIHRPRLLLLDEPVSALDPVGRMEVLALVEELGREATVFMSSHILADVERVCDHVTVLHQGRVLACESTLSLRERYVQPLLRLVVGADGGELAATLERQPWVETVEPRPPEPHESHPDRAQDLYLRVLDLEAAFRGVPVLVAGAGLPLYALNREAPDLEEVFMRMVGSMEPTRTGEER